MRMLSKIMSWVATLLFSVHMAHATTLVGSAAGTNTATAPTHAIGDLMLVCATRNASATAPTQPAGWTVVGTITGTTNSMRVGYKIATATNDATGTWTNATETVIHIYRPTSGNISEVGASKGTTGTVTPASYAGLTLVDQTGASWIVACGQAKGAATTIENVPTGMTLRQDDIQTGELATFDTNGGVASWSTTTVSYTGTATTWKTFTVEILDIPPASALTNVVQRISLQSNIIASGVEAAENISFNLPNASLSGNGLVVAMAYPSGATPAITDDKSNTWPASGAAGTVTADGGAGAIAVQIFRLASATTGTQKITIGFGGSPQQPVKIWALELYNITGTVNGSVTGTNLNTSGVVSPGAFTPTNNNANGGNLVLSFMHDNAPTGAQNPVRMWGNSGYTLLDSDISFTTGQGNPSASQAFLQATSASTTPMFTVNASTDTFNVAAIALSVGSQGTPKPTGIHIDAIHFFSTTSNPALYQMQIPSTGNIGLLVSPADDATGGVTTATDSEGQAWVKKQTFTDNPRIHYRVNYSPNAGRTVLVSCSATAAILMWRYFDISGGDANSFDAYAQTEQTSASGVNTIASQPSITPGGQNELIVAVGGNGQGPTTNVTAPVGATFDEPQYETASFTASMLGTRMTVTSMSWGTISFGGSGIITGTGVAKGTALQPVNTGTGTGGIGTYDISVSQTIVSEAMKASSSDSSNMNYGSSLGHFYNGASTSAESWTWDIANQTSNTVWSGAISFKAAPAGTTTLKLRDLMGVGGFILKRDLKENRQRPSDNDNDMMWLEKVA